MKTIQIGNKDVPKFRLSSTLFGDIKTLYDKFGENEVELSVVARVLGHESEKSGTFLTKVASMRDYGLIDGRGKVHVAPIGAKIAFHPNDEAGYNDALIKAIKRIPLWNILFEKYTQKGSELPIEDFWLDVKELCGLTIEQAQTLAADVRRDYYEDIKMIRTASAIQGAMPQTTTTAQTTAPTLQTPKSGFPQNAPEGYEPVGMGNVIAFLPIDPKERIKEWKKLKAAIDAIIKAESE